MFGPTLPRLLLVLGLLGFSATGAGATAAPAPAADSPPTEAIARPPLALVFVTPNLVLAENFPQAATLSAWLKPVLATAEAALTATPEPPALLVQITLRPDTPPQFELAGRPALAAPFAADLRTRLAALPDLRAPLGPVCVRVQTPGDTASPLTEAAGFVPRLLPPDEAELNRFLAADLAAQHGELRAWARQRALPLLAHHAANSDPQYVGVVALGRSLAALAADTSGTAARGAYRDPQFWRGVMEMAPGDLLVASLPVYLHAADGNLDQASTLLGLLHSFGRDGTLARRVLDDFAARLGPFRRRLTEEVQRGVALHDQGKFDAAIAQHERILAAYPNSAWARYELFFSSVTRDGLDTKKKVKRANQRWDEIAPAIYACNPLHTSQFGATRGKNVGAMLDRLVIHRLANKPPEAFGERVGCMADAALRLEDYGTAALVYWSALGTDHEIKGLSFLDDSSVVLTKDDLLARYLYCLEKLGVPDWKGEFEGNFARPFAQLESALTAHRAQ